MPKPSDFFPTPPWRGPPLPQGMLRSSRSHIEDVKDVAKGVKPAALVNEYAMRFAKEKLGLEAVKVPEGTFTFPILKERLAWIVYCRGNEEAAQRILKIFEKYPLKLGPRPPQYHIELGRALGYSETDIKLFLRTFFSL